MLNENMICFLYLLSRKELPGLPQDTKTEKAPVVEHLEPMAKDYIERLN